MRTLPLLIYKPIWDSRGDFFQAPSIRDIADIGVTIAATAITAPMGGIGGALISAGINLADDALFATLDVAGSYKSLGEAGLEFRKKAACALVNVGAQGLFGGFAGKMVGGEEVTTGIFGASKGIFSSIKADTLNGVIGKTIATGLQTVTTSVATSAINAFNIQYDANGKPLGLGWSGDAFNAGVQGGLISAATSMTSTFTSGALNLGLEGFFGEVYGNGVALSNTIGNLAAQGVNYALTGSASFNLLNFSMFGLKDAAGGTVGGGLFELNIGRDGIASRLGMGGADISAGTLIKSLKGLEAWGVNLKLLMSGQEEAKKYASALRTLYSAGLDAKGNKTKEFSLFEEILAGKTNVVEAPDADYNAKTEVNETTGIKTITLGKSALENGARFGLNILLGHEAYRNGRDDGKEGQQIETSNAVIGHINIAARLGMTYGMDSLSDNDRTEIDALQKAAVLHSPCHPVDLSEYSDYAPAG